MDENLNSIESVYEGFPTYSCKNFGNHIIQEACVLPKHYHENDLLVMKEKVTTCFE